MTTSDSILAVVEKIEPGSVIFLQGTFLESVYPGDWAGIREDIAAAAGHDRFVIMLLTADAGVKVIHGEAVIDALSEQVRRKIEIVEPRKFPGGWQGPPD